MAIPFLSPVDLNRNELLNARIQNLAAAPTHGAGIVYFDTATGLLGVSNGTVWSYLSVASLNVEEVQDVVGAMFGSSTVVTAAYNDPNGTIVLTIAPGQITNAMVAAGAGITADKLADGSLNKIFLAAERTKLTDIATGATANSSDAALRDRTTHTGLQTASTISDFTTAVRNLISETVGLAPATLDTLVELANALGNDANFASTMTTALSNKADKTSLSAVATAGTYASLTGKPTFAATVGDGAATSYVVTHSLGTQNVAITLRLAVAPFTHYEVEKRSTSSTTVTLVFAVAPTLNQYTALITAV